jgi:hypothetical protein
MLVPQVEASASGVLRAAGRNGKGDWHRWSSSKLLEKWLVLPRGLCADPGTHASASPRGTVRHLGPGNEDG